MEVRALNTHVLEFHVRTFVQSRHPCTLCGEKAKVLTMWLFHQGLVLLSDGRQVYTHTHTLSLGELWLQDVQDSSQNPSAPLRVPNQQVGGVSPPSCTQQRLQQALCCCSGGGASPHLILMNKSTLEIKQLSVNASRGQTGSTCAAKVCV